MTEFVPPADSGRPRLLWAGITTIDRTWDLPLRDPFWRLYRNANSGAAVSWAGGRIELAAGRVAVIPAWTNCRGICRGTTSHLFIHFAPAGALTDLSPVLLAEDAGLGGLASALAGTADGSGAWWHRAAALVELALAALGGVQAAGGDLECLYPALAMIEESPAAALPVARLAHSCGLPADRFARLFRARLGLAPAAYVRQRRITAAVGMLRTGTRSIEAIAEVCGFANRFHFTRVFTAQIGRPPASFRSLGR